MVFERAAGCHRVISTGLHQAADVGERGRASEAGSNDTSHVSVRSRSTTTLCCLMCGPANPAVNHSWLPRRYRWPQRPYEKHKTGEKDRQDVAVLLGNHKPHALQVA